MYVIYECMYIDTILHHTSHNITTYSKVLSCSIHTIVITNLTENLQVLLKLYLMLEKMQCNQQ